ncbi:MAG: hypothetical protein H0U49_11200 [Parachlamydiaceae bacterium]|nr:hypothetical protein [Parachlamydiaceae bacterium]
MITDNPLHSDKLWMNSEIPSGNSDLQMSSDPQYIKSSGATRNILDSAISSNLTGPLEETLKEKKIQLLDVSGIQVKNMDISPRDIFPKATSPRNISPTDSSSQNLISIENQYINPHFFKQMDEIEVLSGGLENEKTVDEPLKVNLFLNETKLPTIDDFQMDKFINFVTNDLVTLSAKKYNLLTADVFVLSGKGSIHLPHTRYSSCLKAFIYKNFNIILSKFQNFKKHHKIRAILEKDKLQDTYATDFFNLYELFVKLSVELFQKNDFHSSMTIFHTLNDPAIKWVIEKKNMSPEIKIWHSFLSKISKPDSEYFAKKFDDIRKNKIFHVPYWEFIHQYFFKILDSVKDDELKLAMENQQINDYLISQRQNCELAIKNHCNYTDIYKEIYLSENIMIDKSSATLLSSL